MWKIRKIWAISLSAITPTTLNLKTQLIRGEISLNALKLLLHSLNLDLKLLELSVLMCGNIFLEFINMVSIFLLCDPEVIKLQFGPMANGLLVAK